MPAKELGCSETVEIHFERLKERVDKLECVIEIAMAALLKLSEELEILNREGKTNSLRSAVSMN
jgi:hypothetical protein